MSDPSTLPDAIQQKTTPPTLPTTSSTTPNTEHKPQSQEKSGQPQVIEAEKPTLVVTIATTPVEPTVNDASLTNNMASQGISVQADENWYIFTDPKLDRDRLIAQSMVFGDYLDTNAYRLVGSKMDRILDLGCGEGLMTVILKRLYPDAHVVGADLDSRAIEIAKQKQERLLSAGEPIEYVLGNAEGDLPGGPYDLIYISLVLLHTTDPKKILQNVKKALKPGGYVWIKDIYPDVATAINRPEWIKLGTLVFDTMEKAGRKSRVALELPQMLADLDFADIKVEKENYMMCNDNVTGRVMLGCALGVWKNAIKAISKVNGIPEEELIELHTNLCKSADKLRGPLTMGNFIAKRAGNFISI